MSKNMRFILSFLMLFGFAHILLGQEIASGSKKIKISKPEIIDFCELLKIPNTYEGKKIRTAAILTYGGEDFVVLYCPGCYHNGFIAPVFTEYFRDKTKGKYVGKLPRLKHNSGTIRLILTGTLSKQHLLIDSVEKAVYISRDAGFPDRLSSKARRRAKCAAK